MTTVQPGQNIAEVGGANGCLMGLNFSAQILDTHPSSDVTRVEDRAATR